MKAIGSSDCLCMMNFHGLQYCLASEIYVEADWLYDLVLQSTSASPSSITTGCALCFQRSGKCKVTQVKSAMAISGSDAAFFFLSIAIHVFKSGQVCYKSYTSGQSVMSIAGLYIFLCLTDVCLSLVKWIVEGSFSFCSEFTCNHAALVNVLTIVESFMDGVKFGISFSLKGETGSDTPTAKYYYVVLSTLRSIVNAVWSLMSYTRSLQPGPALKAILSIAFISTVLELIMECVLTLTR